MSGSRAERLSTLLRDLLRDARTTAPLLGEDLLPGSLASVVGALADRGPMRLGRLAQEVGVDPSVASRHVAHAQASGFVTRRPDPADGRAWILAATPAGAERLAQHRIARAAWFEQVLSGWSEQDADTLVDVLTRLRDDARAAAADVHAARTPRPAVHAATG